MKVDIRAMHKKNPKKALHLKRKSHVRKKIFGTLERPRLSVFRSAKHIYVQAIDDINAKTVASASTQEKDIRALMAGKKKTEVAKLVGEALAKRLASSNIESGVFDRNGFRYTGRIAALASGLREAGLQV